MSIRDRDDRDEDKDGDGAGSSRDNDGTCKRGRPSDCMGDGPARGTSASKEGKAEKAAREKQTRRGFGAWARTENQTELKGVLDGEVNLLLAHSVIDTTYSASYYPAVKDFLHWAIKRHPTLETDEELDMAIADYMAELCYIHRDGMSAGSNLLAGVLATWPKLEGSLPHTARALKSWQRLDPGGAGEAIAAETAVVMAEDMRAHGDQESALFMEANMDTYWRQQDGFNLLREDVVILRGAQARGRPLLVALNFGVARRGERSKTGVDQGVIVDHQCVAEALAAHCEHLGPKDKVFKITREHFHEAYYASAARLGLRLPPPHAVRHCGPSRDAFEHFRSLKEIQRRGRWEAESPVKRYSRPSWYASILARTPTAVLQQGQEILRKRFSRDIIRNDLD